MIFALALNKNGLCKVKWWEDGCTCLAAIKEETLYLDGFIKGMQAVEPDKT